MKLFFFVNDFGAKNARVNVLGNFFGYSNIIEQVVSNKLSLLLKIQK